MMESDETVTPAEVSKTCLKKQSSDLQKLGRTLSQLSPRELDSLELDPELRSAVDDARKISGGSALKRQIKFIGGLLRVMDVHPVRESLAALKMQSNREARHHHRLEKWRERLLEDGDGAIGGLVDEAPTVDRQRLRQLVRKARTERAQDKDPHATRALYRYLREVLEQS